MLTMTLMCRRVAKKKFKEDPQAGEQFTAAAMANLTFATRSPAPHLLLTSWLPHPLTS